MASINPATKTASAPNWKEVLANHAQLEERKMHHLRFGYDSELGVRFVLEKAIPLHGHVLDVGTGKGRFVIPLAHHVANVTTVDISAEEQRQARLEAIYAGVADRIRFVIQDARVLPWPVGSFDAVVSWNVFHHLDNPERVFVEMIRMVKPGGKLVLADFSPGGFRLMDAIHGAEGRCHPYPPDRFIHWRARLRGAGFCVGLFQGQHQQVLVASLPSGRRQTAPARRGQDGHHSLARYQTLYPRLDRTGYTRVGLANAVAGTTSRHRR